VTIDHLDVIRSEAERIGRALDVHRTGRIPWSDDWTVAACAQHLGGAHRAVAEVVEGRPTTTFSVLATMERPAVDDPGLGDWVAASTALMLAQLDACEPTDTCWTWWSPSQDTGFWRRRMAHETLVHRWDCELGASIEPAPMDPALAADGIDEYLDVFVGIIRELYTSPGAGERVHVHCTDTDGEWLLRFPDASTRVLERTHAKGDVAYRGPAEGLLLFLWGRLGAEEAGVELLGDEAVHARWRELVPAL
jgi:uncharacterized protein (TIGR03083 family)